MSTWRLSKIVEFKSPGRMRFRRKADKWILLKGEMM